MSAAPRQLVVATGNAHKVEELRRLLPGVPFMGLDAFAPYPPPEEDAPDFVGNAIIKARAGYSHTGAPCLADDSGLSVDALGGAPGVRSARYVEGSDADRRRALLAALDHAGLSAPRTARFDCVLAVAGLAEDLPLPPGLIRVGGCVVAVGVCPGVILRADQGEGGFGYDAIFAPSEAAVVSSGARDAALRSFAQVPPAVKNAVSHRGKAAALIAPFLAAWAA